LTRLCVSLTENTAAGMIECMHRLPDYVDTVEVRLDYLVGPPQEASSGLKSICEARDRDIIVTCRPQRQGGHFQGDESARLEILRLAGQLGADFVDVELDSSARVGELPGGTRRIVSHHDFERMPDDLDAIHRRAIEAGAHVVKIAVRALDITDALPIFSLLQKHTGTTDTIALGMDEEGLCTRILAPKFGAFLSFASTGEATASAAGQVPYQTMEEMYGFSRINPETQVYGVVANPVAHSMSPPIHNAAFAELGMDAVYLPLKVTDPLSFLEGFEPHDLRGLSVTIPHKEAMVPLMDDLDELARRIGALNTVDIRDGKRRGSNTDVAAALAALRAAAERANLLPMDRRKVLLIGAGGAGRALAYGLAEHVEELTIANRTVSRAERLAKEVGAAFCGLDELESRRPDLLINTTSVGMHPNVEDMPVPSSILQNGMVVFDAVYNPIRTRLLREAEQGGCIAASGFEWFVSQAAAQFETWTDTAAPQDVMAEVVRRELERRSP
jgi:3-dehydroquinate dehydratase/shikimate dehydrogenase